MIDIEMQRAAAMVGPIGTQQVGGTIVFDREIVTSFQGTELTRDAMEHVVRVVRFGSTVDAVAAGDLVVDRFLTSLRKLAER